MLLVSEILIESLAFLLYHCNDIKDIVHSIASIVITTISSTKVKACFCLFIVLNKIINNCPLIIFFYKKKAKNLKFLALHINYFIF